MQLKSILKGIIPEKLRPIAERVFSWLRAKWLWGLKFYCPYCHGHFRKLLPSGEKPRPNAQCPACFSLERYRLLWLYLNDKTAFFKERLKVLDIAPVKCFRDKCKNLKNIEYLSADIASPLAMIKMDIETIPFKDDHFDCVFCYHVLEHIHDDCRAMKEIFRVLKPGGWAILQSPVDTQRRKTFEDPKITSPEERARYFGQPDHLRVYGNDYKERLENAGFLVKLDDYAGQLEDSIVKKYALMRDEKIFFCVKPKSA
ncbi:MAG: methyltransferase domain-containing protein [Candidatus Omnitrophica bacterium]|nr:methyltransferase domain-containing protein [Candidatus Omnitrophota bacterium]